MKMLPSVLVSSLAIALVPSVLAACNADNCARAVTGTRSGKMPDVASRQADCSSFMRATVTPRATYGDYFLLSLRKAGLSANSKSCP